MVKIFSPTVYRIQNSRKRKVVHFNCLKPAYYENHAPVSALPSSVNATDSSGTSLFTLPDNDFDGDNYDYIVYLPSCKETPFQQVDL